ncbi:hypothetical protein P8452_72475 [Trifolium repens]|nr:hypothetical protein P8452_72475 [Trifolium repens]
MEDGSGSSVCDCFRSSSSHHSPDRLSLICSRHRRSLSFLDHPFLFLSVLMLFPKVVCGLGVVLMIPVVVFEDLRSEMVCGGCDGSELEWWDESDMTECGGC